MFKPHCISCFIQSLYVDLRYADSDLILTSGNAVVTLTDLYLHYPVATSDHPLNRQVSIQHTKLKSAYI